MLPVLRLFVAVLLLCAAIPFARAGEKPWIEVRSEHFRVLSDGDVQDAQAIAREFEQMRAVFAAGAQNMRLDSGAPLLIFAPRDLMSMARISSVPTGAIGGIAGEFSTGWEKQFAVVRIDEDHRGYFTPVYHEYVHTLLHANFRWIPLWLDEGLAELYGTSQFKESSALVGVPSPRKFIFEHQDLIPLNTLLSINQSSPYYHDGRKMSVFYAEAWALSHFLTFGDEMGRGAKMAQFYNLLQSGTEQEKAFEQVFGPIQDVESKLDKYVHKGKMHSWEMSSPPEILVRNFTVRTMTTAETDAELGGFVLWTHRNLKAARPQLEKALNEDPKLALAHENMGFLDFADSRDDDAVREMKAAIELDPSRYLSVFFTTMMSPIAHSNAAADQAQFENQMFTVLKSNAQFAPAYIQLAMLYARQGDTKKALAAASKAAKLEPTRAGYALLAGDFLLQLGRGADAATIAKYVADRWQNGDRDEAMELWDKVPAQQRPADAPANVPPKDETKQIEGTLISTSCSGEGHDAKRALTLQSDGQERTYRAGEKLAEISFSDTLWYGRDHFDLCHHVSGLRTIVRYSPSSDSTYAGTLVEVQIRVDPPAPVSKEAAQQQSK